ncbi:MAG TPA: hypothetical protein VF852_08500 [Pseudolabrys sp.]
MAEVLFWVLLPYDALFFPLLLPYFWVRAALGIATGLFIPGRIVGLVACALGNVAVYAYAIFASGHPENIIKGLNLLWSAPFVFLFVFIHVVWWVVGHIMRWAFYKIARVEVKSTPTAP